MIQRIQTIYLLLGAALLAVFLGFAGPWSASVEATFAWLPPVAYGLAGFAAAAALLGVFLYKQRAQQLKVVAGAQWIALGLVLVLAVTLGLLSFYTGVDLDTASLWVLVCPVVAYVSLSLARHSVKKDIELVRSMDRLR